MHMLKMLRNFFVGSWFCSRAPPLQISDFKEIRFDSSEEEPYPFFGKEKFVHGKPGGVVLEYYDKDHQIGYIRYYVNTGHIGLFFIQKEYQNRGLGKQILCKVIQELQENNCDEIWAVTSKDHAFWSNVYHQLFSYRDPAHPSVGGDGYFMDLRVHQGHNAS